MAWSGVLTGTGADVTDATGGRRGLLSDGDEFTLENPGSCHLHAARA